MIEQLRDTTLDDKYRIESGTVFVNGAGPIRSHG
jgi:hypothetical protein